MKSGDTNDHFILWYSRLALYRIWRLRRGILIMTLLPLLAFYAGTLFHPTFGPLFFPDFGLSNPFPNSSDVHAYGMVFDGTLFFVLHLFLVATAVAVFQPNLTGFVSAIWVAVSLIIALMPWLWESVTPLLEGMQGLNLVIMLLCFGALRLASVVWRRQWHSGISFPGILTMRSRIHIDRPPQQALAAWQHAPGHCEWNEHAGLVREDPDTPGRRFISFVTGGGHVMDIVPSEAESEVVLESRSPDRPHFVEAVGARALPEKNGTCFETVIQARGFPLLYALSQWVEDATMDHHVYFRDRLEGRQSLSNKATFFRTWFRKHGRPASVLE